jgi:hypothetical protein
MSHLKLSQLRKLIAEEVRKNLLEAKDEPEKTEDSLDAQVDRYLASYESESKLAKNEGKDFRMLVRRFLLEAEEDDEKKDEKEEKPEKPKKLTSEDIDIENFLNSVMRLVDNYDSLLEVRNTVLKRAVNFLLKGYEPDVAKSFEESLLEIHGMEIDKSKSETEDDNYQVPAADRAGSTPGA